MNKVKEKLVRTSVSLPEGLLQAFNEVVEEKNFSNRSQAMSELLHQYIAEHKKETSNDVMAGTINLVYDNSVPTIQKQLCELQYKYLDEIISSLNVNLTDARVLSVMLVQGPSERLKMIANDMTSRRGVVTGKMLLSTAILPPVHPLPSHKNEL